MGIATFFDHAVTGYRRKYPRSKYEMGVGGSIGVLIAIVFKQNPILFWLGTAVAIAWSGFYFCAMFVAIRLEARKGDLDYDRRGKYRLSKEYWDTESASSARAKKAKSKR
jgi:hypothetical protein